MTSARPIRWSRLIGVYDTDSGLLGELAYLTGRLLGVAHCALCEITHGAFGEKPAFRATRRWLGVPIETIHRNDQPVGLRAVTEGSTPCVVGETALGYELLLRRGDLESCRGDVLCLEAALERVLDEERTAEAGRAQSSSRDQRDRT